MKRRCFRRWFPVLFSALVVLPALRANADSTNRGVWCWKSPGPYGLDFILGTNALQNAAVSEFKLWGISHVYGSYGDQLKNAAGQTNLAAWITLLNNNGIESQELISDTSFGSGDNNVLVEMINFNKSQPAAAQFKGVHLDIEPWGLSSWSTDNKYYDLTNLAGVYQTVRTELNTNGLTNVLIYADLADWLDNIGTINWPSSAVRDAWYSGILTNLAGITLMAYEQPTLAGIENVVSWEMSAHPGVVRVGIDAGVGETWANLNSFDAVAEQVEAAYGTSAGVDLYDFATVEGAVHGVLGTGAYPTNAFNMVLRGPVGSNYVVQTSTDLATWQTFTNFNSTSWLTYLKDVNWSNETARFYKLNH